MLLVSETIASYVATVIIVENHGKGFTLDRVTLFEVEHHLFAWLLCRTTVANHV